MDQRDRTAILARRAQFVALALAGVGLASSASRARADAGADATDGDVDVVGDAAGAGGSAADSAAGAAGEPQVCLSIRKPDAPRSDDGCACRAAPSANGSGALAVWLVMALSRRRSRRVPAR